jgi:hypothetical protein
MRPDLSATPPVPLPATPASGKLTSVAPVSGADSHAPETGSHPAPEQLRGEQGMVDPKPQPTEAPVVPIGRRAAPRLRLSLPAQLIAVDKAHTCILLNLSRTGAQVAILDAMRKGEGAILRCGIIDQFVIVTRSEFGLNALELDEPLSDAIVLETRRYHENFEEREKRALIETARKWVTGETGDDRSI